MSDFVLTRGKSTLLIGLTVISGYLLAKGLVRILRRNDTARTVRLIVYPIKSVAGVEVDQVQITRSGCQYGIFHDRAFILLNEQNNMITQRAKPKLSLIKTSIRANHLCLEAPGMETLKIDCQADELSRQVVAFQVWNQDVTGVVWDQEANKWFSQFIGAPTRLVKFISGMEYRKTSLQQDDQIVFDSQYPIVYQDGAPFLLINQPSIDDLNSKLDGSSKVSYRNFRPNILVQAGHAFDEDGWTDIKIGQVCFNNVKPCTRCTLTTVIPGKGVKNENGEPLRTLRQYRVNHELEHLYKDTPLFGVNLVAIGEGAIKLGDEVSV